MTAKKTAQKPTKTPPKGKAAPVKPRTDWEAVERDYRTGKFTLRELATKYECTHQAIGNQIKRHKWTQDLSLAIKQATDAKLVNELVAKSGQDVANTVQAAAELNKQVILSHRAGLKRITSIQQTLLTQIEQAANYLPDLEDVIEMVRNPNEHGVDKVNDQMRLAMSRSSLVDDLKRLAEVDEKVRKGEREAFNLNEETKPDNEIAQLLQSLGPRSAIAVVK